MRVLTTTRAKIQGWLRCRRRGCPVHLRGGDVEADLEHALEVGPQAVDVGGDAAAQAAALDLRLDGGDELVNGGLADDFLGGRAAGVLEGLSAVVGRHFRKDHIVAAFEDSLGLIFTGQDSPGNQDPCRDHEGRQDEPGAIPPKQLPHVGESLRLFVMSTHESNPADCKPLS